MVAGRAKTDRIDARLIAECALRNLDVLLECRGRDAGTGALKALSGYDDDPAADDGLQRCRHARLPPDGSAWFPRYGRQNNTEQRRGTSSTRRAIHPSPPYEAGIPLSRTAAATPLPSPPSPLLSDTPRSGGTPTPISSRRPVGNDCRTAVPMNRRARSHARGLLRDRSGPGPSSVAFRRS